MKVKIKRLHEDAVIPSYSKSGDAGLDLTATSYKFENGCFVYGTGLSVEIPAGYVGLVYPRSSIAGTALYLTNAVGVIDSGYRGEIMFKFASDNDYFLDDNDLPHALCNYLQVSEGEKLDIYKVGDRIGQLIIMPYPKIEFEEAEELEASERGTGGYGHTGN